MNMGDAAGAPPRPGLLTTVAWKLGGETTYALEGSAFIAGAAVQWLRDGLGLIKKAADIEALATTVKDTGDVVFVPALAGLGAPHWRPEARGLFAGLDRSTTAAPPGARGAGGHRAADSRPGRRDEARLGPRHPRLQGRRRRGARTTC